MTDEVKKPFDYGEFSMQARSILLRDPEPKLGDKGYHDRLGQTYEVYLPRNQNERDLFARAVQELNTILQNYDVLPGSACTFGISHRNGWMSDVLEIVVTHEVKKDQDFAAKVEKCAKRLAA